MKKVKNPRYSIEEIYFHRINQALIERIKNRRRRELEEELFEEDQNNGEEFPEDENKAS